MVNAYASFALKLVWHSQMRVLIFFTLLTFKNSIEMKKIITLALMLIGSMSMTMQAQEKSPYVVTLEHEGQLQTFYGTTGFQDAYNAASDGDVITLPPLNCENWESDTNLRTIRKAITIRGTRNEGGQTSIGGYGTQFELPQTATDSIIVEGIIFNSGIIVNTEKLNLVHCTTYEIDFRANATVVNCHVLRYLYIQDKAPTILNSVIEQLYGYGQTGNAIFINCNFTQVSDPYTMPNAIFLNCIITNSTHHFLSTVTVSNSVCYPENYFDAIPDTNGKLNNKVFDPDTFFIPNSFWQLTEEAKATYLGDDGTEVGIYGGQFPWNDTLSTPTITNLNVSKRVAQGETLKIDVEAE